MPERDSRQARLLLGRVTPGTGLNQEVDERSLPAGALLVGENVRLDRQGRWSKRRGVAPLTNTTESGTIAQLGDFRESLSTRRDEVVFVDKDWLRTYDPITGKLIKRGAGVACNIDSIPVYKGGDGFATRDYYKDAHNIDVATGAGYRVYVWMSVDSVNAHPRFGGDFLTSNGAISLAVVNAADDTIAFKLSSFAYDVTAVRVVYLSTENIFVLIYDDNGSGDIMARTFNPSGVLSVASLYSPDTLLTVANPGRLFEAAECVGEGDYFYLVTQDGASHDLSLHKITPNGSPAGTTFAVNTTASGTTPNAQHFAMSLFAVKNESVCVVTGADNAGTDQLSFYRHVESTNAFVGRWTLANAASATAKFVVSSGCKTISNRAAIIYTEYEVDNTLNTYGPVTRVVTVDTSITNTGVTVVTRAGSECVTPWTVVVSRPIFLNSKLYAWLSACGPGISELYNSAANGYTNASAADIGGSQAFFTMALCDMRFDQDDLPADPFGTVTTAAATPIGAIMPGSAAYPIVARMVPVSESFLQTLPVSFKYDATSGTYFSAYNGRVSGDDYTVVFSNHVITADPTLRFGGTNATVEFARCLALGGGLPSYYDGSRSGECGFLNQPWSMISAALDAGGDLTDAEYYAYKFCFLLTLRDGSVLRSPMSLPTQAFVPGAGNNLVQMLIPFVGLSAWNLPMDGTSYEPSIQVEIYRAHGIGAPSTSFKLYSRFTSYQTNETCFSFQDDGSVLFPPNVLDPGLSEVESFQPPALRHICMHKNRLFGITENRLFFTEEIGDGIVPRWSPNFTVEVPGGRLVAIASMDDNLILFSDNAIWRMGGFGPSLSGLDSDYATPIPVTSDLGCTEPKSIVLTPFGIGFRSRAGIYLLSRGLKVEFSGVSVQDLLTKDVRILDAKLHGVEQYIYFLTPTFRLVLDYRTASWFKDTFHANIGPPYRHVITSSGTLLSVHSGGIFSAHSTNCFDTETGGTKRWATMSFSSGYFGDSGSEGWQHVRNVLVSMVRKSACSFQMKLRVNYSSADDSTGETMDVTTLASADGVYFSKMLTVDTPYNRAVQLVFSDIAPATISDTGEGVWVTGFTYDYESQSGPAREVQERMG